VSRAGGRAPEVWGGLECTVNRVGENYFDQCARSGHNLRPGDIDRFAALGIRALRYPVLWETTAPGGPQTADWARADERLEQLRAADIRPIVGLVHHGSGPRHTSLVEPSFHEGLAAFARAVAERYPWVTDFTPVNEPLTTARFSALYGHWYPHARGTPTFTRALLIQCRAIVDAMRAIREVTPRARLIQTEDIGRTYSTPRLHYQAEFENRRRWLSYDLLCGRLDPRHDLWGHLLGWGASEAELAYFLETPTPPDVVGLNYYVTSDRLLDEQLGRYPASSHGGNERDTYADVEAVRARPEGIAGHEGVLQEAWDRYGLPVAFTEVHLGATREEQLRWLMEAWIAACRVQARGAKVEAVTVWSLLGTFDWNTLVTAEGGFYEPGVFDLRSPVPRRTAIADLTEALARRGAFDHPVLASPGWWRRPERLLYPAQPHPSSLPGPHAGTTSGSSERPLLILAASHPFAEAVAQTSRARGIPYCLVPAEAFSKPKGLDPVLRRLKPWAVVHAVDARRRQGAPDDAPTAEHTILLGDLCCKQGLPFLTFSSSLVFDGGKPEPYLESDPTSPGDVRNTALAAVEQHLAGSALVIRTSLHFSPWEPEAMLAGALRDLELDACGEPGATDVLVSPAYLPDLLHAALDLLIDGEHGLWHLAPPETVLLSVFAAHALLSSGDTPGLGCPAPTAVLNRALGSERGGSLPSLYDALARYNLARREHPVCPNAATLDNVAGTS